MYSPNEIAQNLIHVGIQKTRLPIYKMFILGLFAGMYVAMAGAASTIVSLTVDNPSIARLLTACVFPAGLAMITVAGSELFTGNTLIIIPVLEKKVTVFSMLKNWLIVYLGNLCGSILTAAMITFSHIPSLFDNKLANQFVTLAQAKVSLSFSDALIRGILCNILVCIAVWMALGTKQIEGKIIALYFPIMLFLIAGFEHCVANMFYISVGLFTSTGYEITAAGLNWFSFFFHNLLPVTLGNIIGGSLIVGLGYWLVYLLHAHKE